jgi:hypothetical protein
MNALIFEMLAARATAAGNPAVADMLARMRSTPGADPTQVSEELLAQLGNGNPAMAILAKHLAESKANGSSRQTVIDVEPVEEIPAQHDAGDSAMNELRCHVESMFAELQALRQRIDLLASALGACCLCWGQDVHCRFCRGRGQPGFSLPDETLFEEFVLPALRTLRAQNVRSRPSSPTFQPTTTGIGAPERQSYGKETYDGIS